MKKFSEFVESQGLLGGGDQEGWDRYLASPEGQGKGLKPGVYNVKGNLSSMEILKIADEIIKQYKLYNQTDLKALADSLRRQF